jgi:hypothetical protein
MVASADIASITAIRSKAWAATRAFTFVRGVPTS